MEPSVEARLTALEQLMRDVLDRVDRVEARLTRGEDVLARRPDPSAPPGRRRPPGTAASSAAERTPPSEAAVEAPGPRRGAVALDLEELLGGRILAWLGGLAVVLGVVFFVGMAIRNGWIDEPTRVTLAFLGSAALLAGGLYLYERRGQTEAAVATVAAALAALYASVTAATQLYELVSAPLGLAVAGLVGVVGTAIAVRWASRVVAALGILGALLSPVLVDAGTSGVTLAFMAIALVSATAVLLWRRWDWLAAAAFLVSAPQLVAWIADNYEDALAPTLVVLVLFWALYVVAAVGYELRVRTAGLRVSSTILLLANALLVAGVGYFLLSDRDYDNGATAWVLLLAVVHLALAALAFGVGVSAHVAALFVAVSTGLAGVGLALALDGPALVAGWAAEAAILAWAARRTGDRRGHVGAAVFLGLAVAHVLGDEAPVEALRTGVRDLGDAAVALVAVTFAAAVAARSYGGEPRRWRVVLEALAAGALVYLPSIAIVDLTVSPDAEPGQTPQVLVSAFWSLAGLAALVYGLVRDDRRFRVGGLALLAIAAVKVFLYDLGELDEIYRVLSFIALGVLLLAGAFAYQRLRAGAGPDELP